MKKAQTVGVAPFRKIQYQLLFGLIKLEVQTHLYVVRYHGFTQLIGRFPGELKLLTVDGGVGFETCFGVSPWIFGCASVGYIKFHALGYVANGEVALQHIFFAVYFFKRCTCEGHFGKFLGIEEIVGLKVTVALFAVCVHAVYIYTEVDGCILEIRCGRRNAAVEYTERAFYFGNHHVGNREFNVAV